MSILFNNHDISFDDPIISTWNDLVSATFEECDKGYTITEKEANGDIRIATGNENIHHIISENREEHFVYNDGWTLYSYSNGNYQISSYESVYNSVLKSRVLSMLFYWGELEEEVPETMECFYNYTVVDGKLVVEIRYEGTYSSDGKEYFTTYTTKYETDKLMAKVTKITGVGTQYEIDSEGNPVPGGESHEAEVVLTIEYTMDQDIHLDFDPNDYTQEQ